uniref:Uncharacterized protein n=1 Tax=Ciona savignyi TaxID=51511 RepID=H2ZF62_CIOSA
MVAKLTSQFNHMSSPVKQQASQRSKSAGAGKHLQKYRYTGFKPTNELKLKFEQNCEVPSKPTPMSPEHTSVESPINLLVNKNSKPQCSHESLEAKSRYSLCSNDKPEQKSVIVKAEIQTEKVDKPTSSIAAANEEKTSTVNTPFISQPVATTITLTTSTATSAISRTSLLLSKSSKVHSTPRKTYSYTPKYSPKLQKTVSDKEKVDFISMFCRKIETEE